ncbi:unnamed protein product [Durusdinium trenchii]|uniref:ATP-dependent RNA helicase n=1 Tax=Durusdinium trenchii TaxID=1381693 RepID=A0ABP0PFS1_9DINO
MRHHWAAAAALLLRAGVPPFCGHLWPLRPLIPRGLGTKAAVADLGFETLTEVQQETFEPICDGQDLVVRAETGGGKTLSFLLPTMDRIHQAGSPGIELLVLSPVRELSMQIHQEALKLANRFPQVQPVLMVGGSNWEDDLDALEAAEGHAVILIATPGRLQTHLSKTPSFAKRLGQVKTLVLDEVDQLAGELFAEVTEEILQQLCSASQHLFYSATVTEQVTRLIAQVSKSYTFVDALEDEMSIPESIVQTYQVVPTQDMGEALWQSVESARGFLSPPKIVVIFITGRIAAYYAEAFRQCGDLEVFEIHSRMKQQERTTQSDGFRAAASGLLFTSDITSRGLDYPGVTAVIQLGAPESRAEYVHRVGRTGRREREGLGILLLHDFEESWMAQLDGLGLKQSPPLSAPSPRFADLEIPRNVKAQAYYSRINHAMRHPEDLDVLEVFRDAFRFAGSIGALDVEGRPPSLTEQNAQRYGVADISDPAVHIVKEAIQPKVSIAYQLMSAAQIHKVIGPLLDGALQKHSKVVIHFIHGDIAKYYADFLKGRPLEAFEAHSSVSKKVRKKILQSFESAARGALFTAGLSPATLPTKGVKAVIMVGLPSSAKEAKQLVDYMARCELAESFLLATSFESEIISVLDADLKAGTFDQEELLPAVNDKVVLKAYLAWLRYYGLHPLVTDKQPIIQEAQHFFAAATGDGEVPSLTQRMVEDMGLAGVDDKALNVKA